MDNNNEAVTIKNHLSVALGDLKNCMKQYTEAGDLAIPLHEKLGDEEFANAMGDFTSLALACSMFADSWVSMKKTANDPVKWDEFQIAMLKQNRDCTSRCSWERYLDSKSNSTDAPEAEGDLSAESLAVEVAVVDKPSTDSSPCSTPQAEAACARHLEEAVGEYSDELIERFKGWVAIAEACGQPKPEPTVRKCFDLLGYYLEEMYEIDLFGDHKTDDEEECLL
ncbi:MAG: hypothetical protein N2C12_16935 [Planctomycetales bacterium]